MKREDSPLDTPNPASSFRIPKKKKASELAQQPPALSASPKLDDNSDSVVSPTEQTKSPAKQTNRMKEPVTQPISLLDVLLPTDRPPVMMSNPGNAKKPEVVQRTELPEPPVPVVPVIPPPEEEPVIRKKASRFGGMSSARWRTLQLRCYIALSNEVLRERWEQQEALREQMNIPEPANNQQTAEMDLRTRALAVFGGEPELVTSNVEPSTSSGSH